MFINCWQGQNTCSDITDTAKKKTWIFQHQESSHGVSAVLFFVILVFSKESNGWDVIKRNEWIHRVIQTCWKAKMFICSEKAVLNSWREKLAVETSKMKYLSKYGIIWVQRFQTVSPKGTFIVVYSFVQSDRIRQFFFKFQKLLDTAPRCGGKGASGAVFLLEYMDA